MFSPELDRSGISSMKWTAEQKRTGDAKLLCAGTADMDFRSPEPVLNAIRAVADRGHLGYPYVDDSFYSAVENWLDRNYGWKVDARKTVSLCVGIYTSFWAILDAFTEPGDEIIIQTPVHFVFNSIIRNNGRVTVMNPLKADGGRYTMDFENLEKCFTAKTKIFCLCNPHNPVGRAWNREELERVASLCRKHNVMIVSDDVYCGLMFDKKKYIPIASLSPEVSQNTISLFSTSKTYNTTGLRFSYALTENPQLYSRYMTSIYKANLFYGQNIMGIEATKAAYNECDVWLEELMEYIKGNYEILQKALRERLPELTLYKTDGTYFAWIDLRALGKTQKELSERIEKEAHVIVCPGDELGEGGDGFIRINMGCTHETMEEISARLIDTFAAMKSGDR